MTEPDRRSGEERRHDARGPDRRKRQPKIQCPYCAEWDSDVIDSRPSDVGTRRRRKCRVCKKSYSTLEVVDHDGRKSA